jgi:hypothetical protein
MIAAFTFLGVGVAIVTLSRYSPSKDLRRKLVTTPLLIGWAVGTVAIGSVIQLWWPTGNAEQFAEQVSITWIGIWVYSIMWFGVRNGLSKAARLGLVAWLLAASAAAGLYARDVMEDSCTYVRRWQSPLCRRLLRRDLTVPVVPTYLGLGTALGAGLVMAGAKQRTEGVEPKTRV